jgi:hypothetical protein
MPRLRPGDGGVRCSPKAADVVDQVLDAPIAGRRGPATTSPARSSGTRRPPGRAHVHPTEGDQGTLTRPHPQPRITRAPHEPPVDRPPRLFGSRGRRHRFRPPSALAVSHRPKAVDIDACRLAALAAASIRSWHRLAKRPRAGGFGPGTPAGRRRSGCSSRDRMWAAWFWCASRSPGRSAKIAPASSWSGWGSESAYSLERVVHASARTPGGFVGSGDNDVNSAGPECGDDAAVHEEICSGDECGVGSEEEGGDGWNLVGGADTPGDRTGDPPRPPPVGGRSPSPV